MVQAILSLFPLDRTEIIDIVYESLSTGESKEIEALWAEEAERRKEGYLKGEIRSIPYDEVINEINRLK